MISYKVFTLQLPRKLLIPKVRPGWSPQCPGVMSGSANSELLLLSEGTDSPIPWPEGQRRDLQDKCRSCLGSLLTQISYQHHALGFVQTLNTEAFSILNTRKEILEHKCAMCISHTTCLIGL